MKTTDQVNIRNGWPADYEIVMSVMPGWWDGRDLTASLLKLFFIHFRDTVYIAEVQNELVGFLVAFLSQSDESIGYIHFVGVHPDYRKAGIASLLYEKFFDVCRRNSRSVVKCCTSPINKLSMAFHLRMGFDVEPGDGMVDGIPVTLDFLRKNDPKVLFKKKLG